MSHVSISSMMGIFFFTFFDRTYEIPLSGGTPYDTGVDLDPSVSLKGNNFFTYLLTCSVFLPRLPSSYLDKTKFWLTSDRSECENRKISL